MFVFKGTYTYEYIVIYMVVFLYISEGTYDARTRPLKFWYLGVGNEKNVCRRCIPVKLHRKTFIRMYNQFVVRRHSIFARYTRYVRRAVVHT